MRWTEVTEAGRRRNGILIPAIRLSRTLNLAALGHPSVSHSQAALLLA